MTIKSPFERVVERTNTEYIVLLTMLCSGSYMLWESRTFQADVAMVFPQMTAGIVVAGSILLLLKPILPSRLHSIITDGSQIVEPSTSHQSDEEPKIKEDPAQSTVERPLPDSVFAAVITIAYALTGYVAGLLWVTPLFALAYGVWFKLQWRSIAVVVSLSILIAVGFMELINIPIDTGEIINQGGL